MTRVTRFIPSLGPGWSILRLVAAILAAPVLLAAGLTLLVLISALASDAGAGTVFHLVGGAAVVFGGSLFVFGLTLGLAGAVTLFAAGQRGALGWAVTGAILATVFAMGYGVITTGVVRDAELGLAAMLGAAHFLLIRGVAAA